MNVFLEDLFGKFRHCPLCGGQSKIVLQYTNNFARQFISLDGESFNVRKPLPKNTLPDSFSLKEFCNFNYPWMKKRRYYSTGERSYLCSFNFAEISCPKRKCNHYVRISSIDVEDGKLSTRNFYRSFSLGGTSFSVRNDILSASRSDKWEQLPSVNIDELPLHDEKLFFDRLEKILLLS